jgi:dihydroorotase
MGITGLETAVGLAFGELVHKGVIDLVRLIELCSTNPAKIFKLKNRGTLRVGAFADVTILDPDLNWTYKTADSKSKSKNSPFGGWNFTGAAVATIVGGRIVYQK